MAATKNQGLSPAEVAKTQDPIVAPVLPVEAARLIGRNAIIKTKKLANGVLPVIDPILNVNVLGFEKGTGTVQLANFKDSTGVTISNPVIVPDGNLNEGVYVSFYRMKDLQEKFIGRHVVWYNSIVSTVKTFPINFKDSTGKFETKDNTIYLIDYIYTN